MKSNQLHFLFVKKTIFFQCYFLLTISSLYAQQDSIDLVSYSQAKSFIYKNSSKGGFQLEIIPELKGFDNFNGALSIARTHYSRGRGLIDRKSIQIGLEYIPTNNIFAPKIKYWHSYFPLLIEGNIGASALYYFSKKNSSIAFRPEIGLGFYFIQFNYGYTFFLEKNFENLSPHSFSLTGIFPIELKQKN